MTIQTLTPTLIPTLAPTLAPTLVLALAVIPISDQRELLHWYRRWFKVTPAGRPITGYAGPQSTRAQSIAPETCYEETIWC